VHDGMIELETGAYSGRMPTGRFEPFLQLRCLGLPLTADDLTMPDGSFSAFYVEHETRGVFRSDLDPDATVVLEETGPVRATIKADGWYTNRQGERFCRYSIRM